MRLNYFILSCLCLIIAITGCRSLKSTSSNSDSIRSKSEQVDANLKLRFDSVASTYMNWNDIVVPVELNLIQPKEFSITGKATIIKDESIYISILLLGFEAANIFINNDSIYATYKMGRIYLAENIKNLVKGYPIKLGDIQDMLLGRAFIVGEGTINASMEKNISLKRNDENWILTPKSNIPNVNYNYTFDLKNNLLKLLTIFIENSNPILCNYDYYSHTSIGHVAQETTISATIAEKPLKASLRWNFNNARYNSGAKTSWKKPNGYQKVEASTLLKAF